MILQNDVYPPRPLELFIQCSLLLILHLPVERAPEHTLLNWSISISENREIWQRALFCTRVSILDDREIAFQRIEK